MTEQENNSLQTQEEIFEYITDYCTEKFGLATGQQPQEPTNPQQAALLAAISTDRRLRI